MRYLKKVIFIIVTMTFLLGLGSCGKQESSNSVKSSSSSSAKPTIKKYENQKGVSEIINALKANDARFKCFDEDNSGLVQVNPVINYITEPTTLTNTEPTIYGFDDPDMGMSILTFSIKHDLNSMEYRVIENLLANNDISEHWMNYNNGEEKPSIENKLSHSDYLTLKDIRSFSSKKYSNQLGINAIATLHFHNKEGQEKTRDFSVSYDAIDKDGLKWESIKSGEDAKKALQANVMNQIPDTSNVLKHYEVH
ncbi:hypothetical protein [Enterococcus devriesei]|uniref:hypothetical protein n=1 Tax=Enterococcus devriesei TaxID=319970 RepID=UPI0036D40267